ncbi:hypothetical protein BDW74DRAFT_181557 [Aspergillus multicolor]|uniref:uncharacterized protein n=1 Tax=Aspergillus multicolor TaxID=41759 RepID=UPI003CCE2EF8
MATIAVGQFEATTAPLRGLLTRIFKPFAVASPIPRLLIGRMCPGGMCVSPAFSTIDDALELHHHYTPVYIPYDMPQIAAQALILGCLPGGAATYGWRYRPGCNDDPRAGYIPAYARKWYPGDDIEILVIAKRPAEYWVFGGAALTLSRLAPLE